MRVGWAWVTLGLASAWGCGGDAPGERVLRVDSAGVEVVTHLGGAETVPYRAVDPTPVAEIGGDEKGGPVLFQVRDVTLLPGGGVAVAAHGSLTVLVHDEAGALIRSLGREGEGPGEFRSVESVVPLGGDSLGVYDGTLRRLTVFTSDGAVGRTVDLSTLAPPRGWGQLRALGGRLAFVGHGALSPHPDPGIYRDSADTYAIDGEGRILARFGRFPGTEIFISEQMMGLTPFGARLSAAVTGEVLVLGTGETPELRWFDAGGSLVRVVRWPDVDRAVTAERREAFLQASLDLLPPEQAAALRPRLEAIPHPPRSPAFQDLLGTPDGGLWVGDFPGPTAPMPGAPQPARTWLVFDAHGTLVERVGTPEGFQPRTLHGERVWGVQVDAVGVERVVAYRVVGAAG